MSPPIHPPIHHTILLSFLPPPHDTHSHYGDYCGPTPEVRPTHPPTHLSTYPPKPPTHPPSPPPGLPRHQLPAPPGPRRPGRHRQGLSPARPFLLQVREPLRQVSLRLFHPPTHPPTLTNQSPPSRGCILLLLLTHPPTHYIHLCRKGGTAPSAALIATRSVQAGFRKTYLANLDKDYYLCVHEADQEMIGRFDTLVSEGRITSFQPIHPPTYITYPSTHPSTHPPTHPQAAFPPSTGTP